MKVAIYVEGITEAGFVYQLIGEKYQWDWTKVRLECLNLDPSDAADDLRDIGIENAPKAFLGLFKGENFGKMLVKIEPDPSK